MRFKLLYIAGLLFLAGCINSEKAADVKSYFDISGFFKSEAARLQKSQGTIEKSVSQNNTTEKKRVHIENWTAELDLFISADINKPSWKGSYETIKRNGLTEFRAKESNLRTRVIRIHSGENDRPRQIYILNETSNMLYSTREELNYYPDSIYSIKKDQNVLLLGSNHYFITGFLKK